MVEPEGMHPCQVDRITDPLAELLAQQYLVRCRCHQAVWSTWREGDAPYRCPVTGAGWRAASE